MGKWCFWLISRCFPLSLTSAWIYLWKHLSLIRMLFRWSHLYLQICRGGARYLVLASHSTVSSGAQGGSGTTGAWVGAVRKGQVLLLKGELRGRKATEGRSQPVWEWEGEREGGRKAGWGGAWGQAGGPERGPERHTYIDIWTRLIWIYIYILIYI